MKTLLKELLPPLLWRIAKRIKTRPSQIYGSYERAAQDCQRGYESRSLVDIVVEKNIVYRSGIRQRPVFGLPELRTLIALGLARGADDLRVLDFGGGAGYHFEIARAAIGEGTALRWNVVETTEMAKAAARIEMDGLKFFDSIELAARDLGRVDLVLASSALQYCPDPDSYLRQLIDIRAQSIFITRTPLSETADDVVSIQHSKLSANGPGPLPAGFTDASISYPITYLSAAKLERLLSAKYEVRFKLEEEKGAFAVGATNFNMYGYFGVLKHK